MQKKTIYICALVFAPLSGALLYQLAGDVFFSVWDIPASLISLFFVFAWYVSDTNSLQLKRRIWGNCAQVTLFPLALIFYFFKSRSWKKGCIHTLAFFGIMALYAALETLGAELSFRIFE